MNKVLSIMSMFVLMGGVLASVRLVGMNQDIRGRASENGIILCHKTGSGSNRRTIRVIESAVQSHLEHGDSLGDCEMDTDSSPDKKVANENLSNKYVAEPISQNNFVFTFRPTEFKNGLHPIFVELKFVQNNKVLYTKQTTANHVSNGIFQGKITGISDGSYSVFLKTEQHLGKVFTPVNVISGETRWDFTQSQLIAGDFNNDNVLDIFDVGEFLAVYTEPNVPANAGNKKFDLNHDGLINKTDLNLLLENYTNFAIQGDRLL